MANVGEITVKKEVYDGDYAIPKPTKSKSNLDIGEIIQLSSSDSELESGSSSSDDDNGSNAKTSSSTKRKRKRSVESSDAVLPVGFLDPLPSKQPLPLPWPQGGLSSLPKVSAVSSATVKQFWKAGDYEGTPSGVWDTSNGGMDRVRVHPKFLHSNATSHKWALGAFAELLDNSLDEVRNGATYINIDMVNNKKDGSKMLLIEDDGGGMDPDKIRHCMSLGYSAKSKLADTIGQYGNGFKTSTMRLGADVIVFSRCRGIDGKRSSQSIGLLSYTFLRSTGKEDIVVPMLDYERRGQDWFSLRRASASDWNHNVETMVQWSPFSSEADLLQQFNQMQDQGTRIFIYNLWEDDGGLLELDFDSDPQDIQIRGANRDEKSIDMAKIYPNSRHFLTYKHSLRSYAAILYLRIPPNFRIILRGEDVEHHNIVNDMMMSQEVTYRPQPGADGLAKETNMIAVVTVGFVKDAKAHIDVQGFNVYHKNRLIKPFWRVWHPPGSDGRGVIGVLEANFIEPAHDKQGFERTTILQRLETRLIQMQRTYWSSNCHKIGYSFRGSKRDKTPDPPVAPAPLKTKHSVVSDKTRKVMDKNTTYGYLKEKLDASVLGKQSGHTEQFPSPTVDVLDDDDCQTPASNRQANGTHSTCLNGKDKSPNVSTHEAVQKDTPPKEPYMTTRSSTPQKESGFARNEFSSSSSSARTLAELKEENFQLRERLKRREEQVFGELLQDLQKEKERCKSLEAELREAKRANEDLKSEQEALIDIFSEERERRDMEEENLKKKLKEASVTIEQLLNKVETLEKHSSLP